MNNLYLLEYLLRLYIEAPTGARLNSRTVMLRVALFTAVALPMSAARN